VLNFANMSWSRCLPWSCADLCAFPRVQVGERQGGGGPQANSGGRRVFRPGEKYGRERQARPPLRSPNLHSYWWREMPVIGCFGSPPCTRIAFAPCLAVRRGGTIQGVALAGGDWTSRVSFKNASVLLQVVRVSFREFGPPRSSENTRSWSSLIGARDYIVRGKDDYKSCAGCTFGLPTVLTHPPILTQPYTYRTPAPTEQVSHCRTRLHQAMAASPQHLNPTLPRNCPKKRIIGRACLGHIFLSWPRNSSDRNHPCTNSSGHRCFTLPHIRAEKIMSSTVVTILPVVLMLLALDCDDHIPGTWAYSGPSTQARSSLGLCGHCRLTTLFM